MLVVENLVSRYGRIEALHGVSLAVAQGEIVTLVGSNGAGKTTLLRAISGVQPAAGGSIRFAGTPRSGGRAPEIQIENFSGPVELELPGSVGAELSVETFSGSIASEFGGEVKRPDNSPGTSLEDRWGDGRTQISVSTFSGPVQIRKRGR